MEQQKFENNQKTPERLARELEYFIKTFIPSGWVEPIQTVAFCPHLLSVDFLKIQEAIKAGNLENFMQTFRQGIYKKWFYAAAIKAFFDQEKL